MATLYTRRVVGTRVVNPGEQLLATVPLNEVWVIRNVLLVNLGTADQPLDLYVRITGTAVRFYANPAVKPKTVAELDTRVAINPGEAIYLFNGAAQTDVLITAFVFPAL